MANRYFNRSRVTIHDIIRGSSHINRIEGFGDLQNQACISSKIIGMQKSFPIYILKKQNLDTIIVMKFCINYCEKLLISEPRTIWPFIICVINLNY